MTCRTFIDFISQLDWFVRQLTADNHNRITNVMCWCLVEHITEPKRSRELISLMETKNTKTTHSTPPCPCDNRGERERERESAMATSRFSATSTRVEALSHCNSISRLVNFSARQRIPKFFLIRTSTFRRVERSLKVKNISSEPKQRLKDPTTGEGLSLFRTLAFVV